MKNNIKYFLRYFLFWLVLSFISRSIFLIYNISKTKILSFHDFIYVFIYGLKLDISITAYILFFLVLFFVLLSIFPKKITFWFTRIYTILFIVLFTLITFVDSELYRNWGFRMDATILLYLKTPKESLASTPVGLMLLLLFLAGIFIWGAIYSYKKWVEYSIADEKPIKWYWIPAYLIIAGFLIIPIRGGIGIAPINQGAVFFSQSIFANHAALNEVWNLGESLSTMNKNQNVEFFDNMVARQYMNGLSQKDSLVNTTILINDPKPNILIIILESFTANVIEPLGGMAEVTPNFTRLAKEGVLFSNFYASGDRSDKGIVSILSGYPAQPTTSIIKYINKTAKLPHLSKHLMDKGYSSGFYYGGEINFANMNSYFIGGGYQHIVSLENFSGNELNSKWGAHDHVVFDKLKNDLDKTESPFFRVMFTLSSHDPFDVPHKSRFNGSDEESRFLNSVHYTDSCLGDFIDKAKVSPWWRNTWIIIVADHGSRLPGNIAYNIPEKFRIPMVWTGGVINSDTIIGSTASQTDIPQMVCNQMGQHYYGTGFGKDVLSGQKSYAFYAYNNGFGFFNDSSGFVWDITSNKLIEGEQCDENTINSGKAFMQTLSSDFNSK